MTPYQTLADLICAAVPHDRAAVVRAGVEGLEEVTAGGSGPAPAWASGAGGSEPRVDTVGGEHVLVAPLGPTLWVVLARAQRFAATEIDLVGRVVDTSSTPTPDDGPSTAERSRAHLDLERSTARIEALVEAQHDAVLLEDEQRRIVLSNQAMCDMFSIGAPPEALIGADCAAALDQAAGLFQDPARFARSVHAALAGGEPVRGEVFRTVDGRYLERDYFPLSIVDQPSGHLWQYRDVTEQRTQREELVRAKAAAEAADAAKSDFLAVMSHEIRTPMNAILGMAELLLDTPLTDQQRAYVRSLSANSDALLTLIDDVLDVAKIEAGGIDVASGPVDLVDLVESVAEAYAIRAREDVVVYCDFDPTLPAQLVSDAGKIRQMIANLVSNAVKYTDAGEIEIRVRVTDLAEDRCSLLISVRDTGIGIPPEEQARVFDKYAQSRTTTRAGTGLGLHITRSLATLLGGDLSLSSRLGEGSTFSLRLDTGIGGVVERRLDRLREPLAGSRIGVVTQGASAARAVRSALRGEAMEVRSFTGGLDGPLDGDSVDVVVVEGEPPPELVASGLPLVQLRRLEASGSDGRMVSFPIRREVLLRALCESRFGRDVATEPGGPDSGDPLRPLTVLVVEDNADNRVVAAGILERHGHRVILAEDGVEGVARVESDAPDVVLMDLHMPRLDGVGATRSIRAWERQTRRASVPIIAFSAHASANVREEALDAGCMGFLGKPVRPEELLAALTQAADPRARILCVDDARDSRRLLRHHLGRAGYCVLTASDGRQALDSIERERLDLVFMDVEMPGIDGFEAVREIRRRGWNLPVVATTGHTSPETHRALRDAGFDRVLTKPIRGSTLMGCARDLLESGSLGQGSLVTGGVHVSGATVARIDADLAPLIPPFLEDRQVDVRKIRDGIASGDWDAVFRLGHSMEGTGTAYGFEPVSTIGAAIKAAAQSQDASGVHEAIADLERYLEDVQVVYEWADSDQGPAVGEP